ncbi:MAG: hypothetical protein GY913_21770 [Proteobacteria bacterium]|nr:hypothetical protein [Pseudomonadota bacterium]
MQTSFLPQPAGAIPGVDLRDRWGTPEGVIAAPLQLFRADTFDLDAAAEPLRAWSPYYIGAETNALAVDWRPYARKVLHPLVWLNPPFSKYGGGKSRWIDKAVSASRKEQLIVCLYLPGYADYEVAALDGYTDCRITMVGRVSHSPPPGVEAGHPDRHQHAIHVFTPHDLRLPPLLAWDWRRRAWVGRTP